MDRREFLALTAAISAMPARAFAQQMKPLKIGVMNDLSSIYSDDQGIGSSIAAKMAVDDWSAKLGVPVEIVIADHQQKPDVGVGIARRWFEQDGVDVVMDLPNSAVALAVLALANEKNKAVIGSGAGSSVLTGPMCSRNFVHWTYDTYSSGSSVGKAVTEEGGKSWFFITADYAFGKDLRDNCAAAVEASGGKVLGDARHPLNTADFSSFLLQAQSSGADVVAFANAGGDMITAFKQAHEFGLTAKQKLVGFVMNIVEMPALGLETAQGSLICTPFYWDTNEATRAFGKRYLAAHPKKLMPDDMQAGMYSATAHLLKAVAKVGGATDGLEASLGPRASPSDLAAMHCALVHGGALPLSALYTDCALRCRLFEQCLVILSE